MFIAETDGISHLLQAASWLSDVLCRRLCKQNQLPGRDGQVLSCEADSRKRLSWPVVDASKHGLRWLILRYTHLPPPEWPIDTPFPFPGNVSSCLPTTPCGHVYRHHFYECGNDDCLVSVTWYLSPVQSLLTRFSHKVQGRVNHLHMPAPATAYSGWQLSMLHHNLSLIDHSAIGTRFLKLKIEKTSVRASTNVPHPILSRSAAFYSCDKRLSVASLFRSFVRP